MVRRGLASFGIGTLAGEIGRYLMRIAAIFVAVCMVLIAGSAGAVVYLYFGLSLLEAIAVAIAILAALALYNTISTRLGLRRAVGHQLSDLSRGVTGEIHHVDAGYHIVGMKHPDAPDIDITMGKD